MNYSESICTKIQLDQHKFFPCNLSFSIYNPLHEYKHSQFCLSSQLLTSSILGLQWFLVWISRSSILYLIGTPSPPYRPYHTFLRRKRTGCQSTFCKPFFLLCRQLSKKPKSKLGRSRIRCPIRILRRWF